MGPRSMTFTFINLNEPKASKDEGYKKLVRSNAMRSYRWKQKQKAISIHAHKVHDPQTDDSACLPVPVSRPLKPNKPSAFRHACSVRPFERGDDMSNGQQLVGPEPLLLPGEEDLDNDDLMVPLTWKSGMPHSRLMLNPSKIQGDGLNDPFNAYPIGGCSRYNSYVLNHFIIVMTETYLPIDAGHGQNPLTKIWIPYALTDPVLFLATLNFAAVHLDVLRGKPSSLETLAHRGQTLRLINARLESSTEAVADTTIGSVLMLAAMETLNGSCKGLRIHMEALARMVKMRGGLRELGWSGVLHMFISWQDMIYSATTTSTPRFARTPVMNGNSNFAYLGSRIAATKTHCEEMALLLNNMRYLNQSLAMRNKSPTADDFMSSSTERSTLEQRLLSMQISRPKEEMRHIHYMLEACRLAALIYLKCAFYSFRPTCPDLRNLKNQIISLCLEAKGKLVDANASTRLQHSSVTWVLFMGGILSVSEEEEDWFAKMIAKFTRHQSRKSWADMEEILKEICWVDCLRTQECISLWNRVASLSGTGPGRVEA